MRALPKKLEDVIESLSALPGVGPRSAERYAYFLLQSDKTKSQKLAGHLNELHDCIHSCPKTFALIDKDQKVSPLYSNPNRDKHTVMVVEDPFDIAAVENTNQFKGTYHVLGGLISPIDGMGPEKLNISSLIDRVKNDNVEELILAINASVEGESTSHYISNQLKSYDVRLTRLARGLPVGLDLEYADQITLSRALESRQSI